MNIHRNLGIILRVASSSRKVDTIMLRQRCLDVYLGLLTDFPWVYLSPSLHTLWGHVAEMIEENDGFGLGTISEQGSEGM